ncbi:MAG TPA: 5-formyltetrahydrofolate cyclo-ligase [Actinomycetota bacterium]|nr:5-formyltetrahydrofolate cyclo-ligase [Actinomycetota bacterium]
MDPERAAGEKDGLRRRLRQIRQSIPELERPRLVEQIEDTVLSLPEMEAARTVLLFYSFGSEVGTSGMAARVLGAGKRLLLPFLDDESGMEAAEVRPGSPLTMTTYGPREPAHRVAVHPHEVDVVVTPGLGFDRRGHRLGYGGGHYDRYLERLGERALRVGVAFSVQIVRWVPTEQGDQPVDVVVTDSEIINCRTRSWSSDGFAS